MCKGYFVWEEFDNVTSSAILVMKKDHSKGADAIHQGVLDVMSRCLELSLKVMEV